jgi:hypothetical protein
MGGGWLFEPGTSPGSRRLIYVASTADVVRWYGGVLDNDDDPGDALEMSGGQIEFYNVIFRRRSDAVLRATSGGFAYVDASCAVVNTNASSPTYQS